MIDCETARELMEEERPGPALQAHLEQCAACREEWRFAEQVAASVAALPRQSAPDGFAKQVMAVVRDRHGALQPSPVVTPLLLRPWELAGAALLCLLGLVALWMSGQPRLAAAEPGSVPGRWLAWAGLSGDGARATLRRWSAEMQAAWHRLGSAGMEWSGELVVWGCGALAFSVAFYLLLSFSRSTAATVWEDAHA